MSSLGRTFGPAGQSAGPEYGHERGEPGSEGSLPEPELLCRQSLEETGHVIGRKRTFVVGVALFTIASILCGLAWNEAISGGDGATVSADDIRSFLDAAGG